MYRGEEHEKILLWTMFVGGTGALQGSQRMWFVERLALMRRGAGLMRWEDANAVLVNYTWSEAHCTASYESFWNETMQFELEEVNFS